MRLASTANSVFRHFVQALLSHVANCVDFTKYDCNQLSLGSPGDSTKCTRSAIVASEWIQRGTKFIVTSKFLMSRQYPKVSHNVRSVFQTTISENARKDGAGQQSRSHFVFLESLASIAGRWLRLISVQKEIVAQVSERESQQEWGGSFARRHKLCHQLTPAQNQRKKFHFKKSGHPLLQWRHVTSHPRHVTPTSHSSSTLTRLTHFEEQVSHTLPSAHEPSPSNLI